MELKNCNTGFIDRSPPNFRYRLYSERVSSFIGVYWSSNLYAQAESLAEAGLYYQGPGDRVKCAFCLRILKNWAINDHPLLEHKRHYPDCAYVNNWTAESVFKKLLDHVIPKSQLKETYGETMSLALLKAKLKADFLRRQPQKRKRGKLHE